VYTDAADVDDNDDDHDNNNKQYHLDGGKTMCPAEGHFGPFR